MLRISTSRPFVLPIGTQMNSCVRELLVVHIVKSHSCGRMGGSSLGKWIRGSMARSSANCCSESGTKSLTSACGIAKHPIAAPALWSRTSHDPCDQVPLTAATAFAAVLLHAVIAVTLAGARASTHAVSITCAGD